MSQLRSNFLVDNLFMYFVNFNDYQDLVNCIWSPFISFRGQISIELDPPSEKLDLSLKLEKMKSHTKMSSTIRAKVTG